MDPVRLPDAGVTQLVECDLAKVDVAGSNPVSRSIPPKTLPPRLRRSLNSYFSNCCVSRMIGVLSQNIETFWHWLRMYLESTRMSLYAD